MSSGAGDALITLPLNKAEIARHVDPSFRGHTEWLAERTGLERYGRDYLMTFLAEDLQVALLSTHVSLRDAMTGSRPSASSRRCAVSISTPAAASRSPGSIPTPASRGCSAARTTRSCGPRSRSRGRRASTALGPFSPDSLFARARRGEFDWVLALYHDQGLIAVKTASFGAAANWTLGLPWLRTSVDHGTAYDLAGTGRAEVEPLRHVVATTLRLLADELPRGRRSPVAR